MAEPLPLLKTTKEPTIFNDYASTGALIGTFAVPVPGVGTALGGLIGGGIGKQKMERELATGKKLRNPSPFNLKIFTGALQGAGIGLAILGVAALAGLPTLFAFIGVAATCIGTVVGGIKGSADGKKEMAAELAEAQQQQEKQEKDLDTLSRYNGKGADKAPAHDYGENHPAAQAEKRGYSHVANYEQRQKPAPAQAVQQTVIKR